MQSVGVNNIGMFLFYEHTHMLRTINRLRNLLNNFGFIFEFVSDLSAIKIIVLENRINSNKLINNGGRYGKDEKRTTEG